MSTKTPKTASKPPQPQDKYVLRMPDGLRDRVKAYAARHGRSMNSEIIRILEREFPAPENFEERMVELLRLTEALRAGASDERISELTKRLQDTLEDAWLQRFEDVGSEAQGAISHARGLLKFDQLKRDQEDFMRFLDDEERAAYLATGETTKDP